MTTITKKRLEKAKKLARIFEDFEESSLSASDFCKNAGIPTSKFYYWRGRYIERGIEGLMDLREGEAYKMTEEVKTFILREKIRDRSKSGIDLSKMIEEKFGKTVSVFHIQRFLKQHRLNEPPGRKAGKLKIKSR